MFLITLYQPFIRPVKLVDLIQNEEICATDHLSGVFFHINRVRRGLRKQNKS